MIAALGAVLSGLLISAQQDVIVIRTRHDLSPRYNRVEYESACGSTVFRVRYRNGLEERGRVEHVLIDGRPVAGAAEILDLRAARRVIDNIGIMHCGMDPERPAFRGSINLSEAESRVASMRPTLFFRITRQGGGDWRLTMDD